jgi:FkbM family methyltransferase
MMETLAKRNESRTGVRILLGLARWGHKCLPVAQLRTVNWILKLNGDRQLQVPCRLFDYQLELQAHRSAVHAMLYLKREAFVEDAAVLAPYLKPGMTVFDVGANIGYLTYLFCRGVEPGGQVFSFEPDAANFSELAANVKRNGIAFCSPLQAAVGAKDGVVCFRPGLNGYIDAESGSLPDCPMISLDSFVEQRSIPQVDLVKIDVEGWELDVLQGMRGILGRGHRPILYVEVHPQGFLGRGDPEKVCSFLRGYYGNVIAFRTWSDTRGAFSAWRRLGCSLRRDAACPQAAPVGELLQSPDRFQLLCLPENGWSHKAGNLTRSR